MRTIELINALLHLFVSALLVGATFWFGTQLNQTVALARSTHEAMVKFVDEIQTTTPADVLLEVRALRADVERIKSKVGVPNNGSTGNQE